MSFEAFNLFPPGGIEQTIHVAVLLGLLALLALTEWFGWVFSGLVVPGYLAALALFAPASAAAVLVESLLVLAIARLISDYLSRTAAWTRFFGRERFFLLVLVSVVVRQQSELWIMPAVLRFIDEQLGLTLHVERDFHAVGLVLVPLAANMFWKLELRRGLLQVFVPTLFAFVVLRFLLVPYTNLSCSLFELGQESAAIDALGSPKAYIFLLIGAYLGARFNLRYGWDYGGILVPALLGVSFFSPLRLLVCVAEALLIAGVVRLFIKLPGVSTTNLEGPRKMALVFFTSFILKYWLGWVVVLFNLNVATTDLFGFGYLVSSLLALKILQRKGHSRVLAPTLQVAFVTLVLGSCASFALEQVAPAPLLGHAGGVRSAPTTTLVTSPLGVMGLGRVRALPSVGGARPLRSERQLDAYEGLWRDIDAWLVTPRESLRLGVQRRARGLGLTLAALPNSAPLAPAFALFEAEEGLGRQLGWDTAILVPGAPGPVLEAPLPHSESPSAEAAVVLCARIQCRAVIASGIEGDQGAQQRVRSALGARSFVQVRADASVRRERARLYVHEQLPELDLRNLWAAPLDLSWSTPPMYASARRSGEQVSILAVHPQALEALLAADAPPMVTAARGVSLTSWLRDSASLGSGRVERVSPGYTAPSESELSYLERAVFAPSLAASHEPELSAAERARLINRLAQSIGYQLTILPDCAGRARACWVLSEMVRPGRLGWGVLAVRPEGAPLVLEVPRPRHEVSTWRVAGELFQSSGARAIYVASDALVDPALLADVATPLQAFHQAASETLQGESAPLLVQVRGFSESIEAARVVVLDRQQRAQHAQPARLEPLLTALNGAVQAPSARFFDGESELLALAGNANPQLHYSSTVASVPCALLWLSEEARRPYFERDGERLSDRLSAVDVVATTTTARALLSEPLPVAVVGATVGAGRARFDALLSVARSYAATANVQTLRRLVAELPPGVYFAAGQASDLEQPYLFLATRDGERVLRALVLPGGQGSVAITSDEGRLEARVEAALLSRPEVVFVAGPEAVL